MSDQTWEDKSVVRKRIVAIVLIAALAIAGCKRAAVSALHANPNACGDPVVGIDSWQIATCSGIRSAGGGTPLDKQD